MNFGKILVFTNLVLALLCAGWAIGVVKESLTWAPSQTTSGEPIPGKVGELHEELKKQFEFRAPIGDRYKAARASLSEAEEERNRNREWYAQQLKIVEEGPGPVLNLVTDKETGRLVRDKKEPLKIRDQDAEAINAYNKKNDELRKQIKDLQEEVARLLKREQELTIEVTGEEGKKLGLRRELAMAELALKNAQDEQGRLVPEVANNQAEAQLLAKRRVQLEARLKELQALTAGGGE
jgi:hypothetical protein